MRPARDMVDGRERVDVAIVGAGITGLSTALNLAELRPDLEIVVVEAGTVAAGSSGSGTGLVGPRIGPALHRMRRSHGDEIARASYRWSQDAVAHVVGIIRRHGIECGLTQGRQLVVAADRRSARSLLEESISARSLGLDIEFVPPHELPAVATRYVSGLRYGPAATIDPAALTHGLAEACERHGVTILEHSRVLRVEPDRRPTIVTDRGRVVSEWAVVAVNAFAGTLATRPDVLPLRVQAGITDPLPAEACAQLVSLRTEPLIEHGELSPYFRLTPDNRLVVGGGSVAHARRDPDAHAVAFLDEALRSLHPALEGHRVTTTWSGPIAMTRDGFPIVGHHRDNASILRAGGCCGHGIAVSAYNGAFLARWIANGYKDDCTRYPWLRSKGPWIPSGPLFDRLLGHHLARLSGHARIARPA